MSVSVFIRKNILVITLHLAGILLYILSPLFFGAPRSPRFENIQVSFILHNVLIATFFYLNILVLMPFILKKKGWIVYIIAGFICASAFGVVSHLVREAFMTAEFRRQPRPNRISPFPYFGLAFPYLVAWVFSGSVKFSMDYLRLERERKESENENLKSELSLLRSQISPHFMFNILNSLTALARKKSDALEPVIIKLSQLMRYTIYHSAIQRVDLETELEYLENYIDLQRLRFGQHISISFEKKVEQPDFQIEPMLLISFVENAFKHGSVLVTDPVIGISITCREGILNFDVKNKFVPHTQPEETHGVGLRNVKRRLELLYENKYELKIKDEGPWFTVNLTLIGK
jgi:two-component system LytT family sensor kinase